jgi:hypothetical protein
MSKSTRTVRVFSNVALLTSLSMTGAELYAQQPTEAKIYQNYPKNLQMVQVGYALQTTNSTVDSYITLPSKNINVDVHAGYLRYARFFDFYGRTAAVQVVLPYAGINADILGVSAFNDGFGDATVVIGSNIFGGPSLSMQDFVKTPKQSALAWSLAITTPTGSYSSDKLLNPSSNRWVFRPEIAFTVPVNRFDFELYASTSLFTDNNQPPSLQSASSSYSLQQDPFYGFTFHTVYNVNRDLWVSFDATSRLGGKTSSGGVDDNNAQSLLALGGTVTCTLDNTHQFGASVITSAAGNDHAPEGTVYSIKYSYLFGAM